MFGRTYGIASQSCLSATLPNRFFFVANYTSTDTDAQHAHTLTPINTHMQTLPLWAPTKDCAGTSRYWWSHHIRLAVDGNIAYRWKHNAVKSWDKFRKMRSTVPSRGLEPGWVGSTTRNLISSRNSLFYQMFMKIALALPVKLLYRTKVKKLIH